MKELNENEIKAVAGASSGVYTPNGPSFPFEAPPWIRLF